MSSNVKIVKDYKAITIESYDKTVNDYIAKVDSLHPFNESKKFLSLLRKKALILDLGCGPGRDAKVFANKGFRVIGVDLSEKMIKAAKKRVKNAQFKVMDTMKLDFKDKTFDGIWASAVLLHIPKRHIIKALREVNRVLKEKGVFYLSVKEGEGEGETLVPDERYGGVQKFWAFFQKSEIEEALKKAGFAIIKSLIDQKSNSYATNPWIHIICRK